MFRHRLASSPHHQSISQANLYIVLPSYLTKRRRRYNTSSVSRHLPSIRPSYPDVPNDIYINSTIHETTRFFRNIFYCHRPPSYNISGSYNSRFTTYDLTPFAISFSFTSHNALFFMLPAHAHGEYFEWKLTQHSARMRAYLRFFIFTHSIHFRYLILDNTIRSPKFCNQAYSHLLSFSLIRMGVIIQDEVLIS
jgi:hypothetical protein